MEILKDNGVMVNMRGLIGKKLGMSRFFSDNGSSVPVTIIKIVPNYITQIKHQEIDGYDSIQVTTGIEKLSKLNKPTLGHLKKSGVRCGRRLWEFRVKNCVHLASIGDAITIKIFESVKKVDVVGVSKGKGFSGTIKRWNFRMQDASHGNSLSHRAPGSIGQNQTPGRVFKGKKMAGQLGDNRITVQNLDIIDINIQDNLLLVKGAIPGSIGKYVIVKKAIKV